jgi:hypothetical protein
MRRRELLTAIVGVVCVSRTTSGRAQGLARARVGYLSGGAQATSEFTLDVLKLALRDLGWRAGETLAIEERFAQGDFLRVQVLANSLATAVHATLSPPPSR